MVNDHQNAKPSNGDGNAKNREQEAMSELVRTVRHEHAPAERSSPRGNTVELCADRRVAVGSDDGWSEVCVAGASQSVSARLSLTYDPTHPYAGTIKPKYIKPPRKILKSLKTFTTSLAVIGRSTADFP